MMSTMSPSSTKPIKRMTSILPSRRERMLHRIRSSNPSKIDYYQRKIIFAGDPAPAGRRRNDRNSWLCCGSSSSSNSKSEVALQGFAAPNDKSDLVGLSFDFGRRHLYEMTASSRSVEDQQDSVSCCSSFSSVSGREGKASRGSVSSAASTVPSLNGKKRQRPEDMLCVQQRKNNSKIPSKREKLLLRRWQRQRLYEQYSSACASASASQEQQSATRRRPLRLMIKLHEQ